MAKVLIACECSGIVREAFKRHGHDAWSCDLKPSDIPGQHSQCDMWAVLLGDWDLVIVHPDCTYLANSGNRWYARTELRQKAVEEVKKIWALPIKKLAIENPQGVLTRHLGRPQYIQPWQFGHGETKKTGLWLRGLPKLEPTNIVEGRDQRIWRMAPGPSRKTDRSRTFSGIAEAFADQWGKLLDAPSPSA